MLSGSGDKLADAAGSKLVCFLFFVIDCVVCCLL
jgi:hypothetical protein